MAYAVGRPYWAHIRRLDSSPHRTCISLRKNVLLAVQMQLRDQEKRLGPEFEKWAFERLRLYEAACRNEARYAAHGVLQSVARDVEPLLQQQQPSMAELWWPRHTCMRRLVRPCRILARYGAELSGRADHRAHRQQRQLRSQQLHMDSPRRSGKEPASSKRVEGQTQRAPSS